MRHAAVPAGMATQDEARWLLDTLISEWPTGTPPDTLALRNRDEPVTWYPNPTWSDGYERVVEQGVDMTAWSSISVSSGGTTQSLYGTSPQYDVETVLDVRVEAAHVSAPGTIESDTAFNLLVDDAQEAINSVRTYPEVDPDADDIARVTYLTAQIQDEDRQSSEYKDAYRTNFSVRLDGDAETP